jgi:transposase
MMDTISMAEEDEGGVAGAERRRRYWNKEEKGRIVAESLSDGASVAEVARRYGVNANLLFTWRRQLAALETKGPPAILPVTIAPMPPLATTRPPSAAGRMEITLSSGEKVVVGADVETAALTRVIKALRR